MAKYEGAGFNNVVSVEILEARYRNTKVRCVYVTNKEPDMIVSGYSSEDFGKCLEWIRNNIEA